MLVDILSITLTFLLLFFLSRGVVDMYIQKQIKNRRHREERKKGQSFGTVLQRTVLQEYGISRKRYAVFCVCGHKRSACQEN